MASPFDHVKTYSAKDKDLLESDLDVKEYVPFIVNRALSFMQDTVFFANEMNKSHQLDKDMIHYFYFHGIPKGKRFGAWQKKSKESECINNIMEFYNVNASVANSYMKLLTEDQLSVISERLQRGGKNDSRKLNRGGT